LGDWTFETSQPATAGPFSPEIGSGSASGFHAGAAVYSSPSGNGSFHSFSSTLWAVNDYYQFEVNTLGYSGVTLSFDQTSSNTGPGGYNLAYSTDGVNFNVFASYTVLANASPNITWNTTTYNNAYTFNYDLSAIPALNNQSTVFFRLVDDGTVSASGGTVGTAGTDRVDNFVVSATLVPEPATTALCISGGLAGGLLLASLRRRNPAGVA
ncbi:MAG TPA: hypothetical protein VMJ12_06810, partial [Candidatus Acidoferrales bacterium]|nr:hypothetical protein [Candidatus Acidoferrales bacterium]